MFCKVGFYLFSKEACSPPSHRQPRLMQAGLGAEPRGRLLPVELSYIMF